jgi:hypothetical protein
MNGFGWKACGRIYSAMSASDWGISNVYNGYREVYGLLLCAAGRIDGSLVFLHSLWQLDPQGYRVTQQKPSHQSE